MSTTTRKTFPPPPNHVAGAAAMLPVEQAALVGAPVTPVKIIPEIPLVSAILFRSPGGQTWRLRISPMGTLLIDPAP